MAYIKDNHNVANKNLKGYDYENDQIYGLDLDDELFGLSGDDLLDGGSGNDKMTGGSGDDTYILDSSGDQIIEFSGMGIDTAKVSFSYSLNGKDVENLTLLSGALWGEGNDFSNILIGNGSGNSLHGFQGNDTLNGGAGADDLYGGMGDDTYYVDSLNDEVFESANEGIDTIYASVNLHLAQTPQVERLTLTGNASSGFGNGLDNLLVGNNLGNGLYGGSGKDGIFGGGGNDSLLGEGHSDRLFGEAGDDDVYGGSGSDYVAGAFMGTNLNEIDELWGGDFVNSDAASDTFVLGQSVPIAGKYRYYHKAGTADYALIHDFSGGLDKIQVVGSTNAYSLQGINFTGNAALDTGIYYQGDLIAVVKDTTNVVIGRDFVSV